MGISKSFAQKYPEVITSQSLVQLGSTDGAKFGAHFYLHLHLPAGQHCAGANRGGGRGDAELS